MEDKEIEINDELLFIVINIIKLYKGYYNLNYENPKEQIIETNGFYSFTSTVIINFNELPEIKNRLRRYKIEKIKSKILQ